MQHHYQEPDYTQPNDRKVTQISLPFDGDTPLELSLTAVAGDILNNLYIQATKLNNTNASKILLDRILPPRKLTTTLPSLPILFNNELTLQQEAQIITDLMFKGSISVEAGTALLGAVKIRSDLDQAAKLVELEAKLNALIEDS